MVVQIDYIRAKMRWNPQAPSTDRWDWMKPGLKVGDTYGTYTIAAIKEGAHRCRELVNNTLVHPPGFKQCEGVAVAGTGHKDDRCKRHTRGSKVAGGWERTGYGLGQILVDGDFEARVWPAKMNERAAFEVYRAKRYIASGEATSIAEARKSALDAITKAKKEVVA